MKGSERRASRLCQEYESKLRVYDVRFHGAAPLPRGQPSSQHPPGPLVQRFRSYEFLKLVAGPWGDLSEDFHLLIGHLAQKRVESKARSRGSSGQGVELSIAIGEIRRALSVKIVRNQALCLLERLAHLRPGARAAGERRRVVEGLEERRRKEAQAYGLAHRQRGLSRVGQAFIL